MAEQGTGGTAGGAAPGARPSASSMIAELWSEREQSQAQTLPPAPIERPRRPGRPGRQPRGRGDGRTGLVVGVVALALLLGGGLGVYMATQGFGMPSRAKYAAKADAICRPANGAVTSISKPTSYPDLATAAGTLVPATDAQMGGLKKLKQPGGADGNKVGALLSAMTQTNAAGRSLQDAAGRMDDGATAAATQRMRTSAIESSNKAKELGFAACAAGMQPGVEAVVGGAAGVLKTAFIAKADSLCRAAARAMAGIPEPRSGADLVRYFARMLPLGEKMTADFKELPVPPGDEAKVAEIVAALDTLRAKEKEAADAARSGDSSRFIAIEKEYLPLVTAVDAKLDAYGLAVCGSNFGD
ncbi:MAG: hypothetical protein ACR2LJ_10945 [Acidimicrobiales bacterium]